MASEEVRQSFERCEAAGDFAEQFYQEFLGASDEIAPHFAQTDFENQRKLLRASVYVMVTRDLEDARAKDALERIGRSHARSGLSIRPELYELWLDSVCDTVKTMDPEWTAALESAWREQLRPGISLITSFY